MTWRTRCFRGLPNSFAKVDHHSGSSVFAARPASPTLQRPTRRDQKPVRSTTRCETGKRRLLARDRPLKQRKADDPIARIAVQASRTHRPEYDAPCRSLQCPFHGTSTNRAGLRLGFSPAEATEPTVFPLSNSSHDTELAFAVLHAAEATSSLQTNARTSASQQSASDLRTSPKRNPSKPTTPRKTVRCLSNFERTKSIGPNPSEASRASCAQPQLIA